jgi:hypothetical protein
MIDPLHGATLGAAVATPPPFRRQRPWHGPSWVGLAGCSASRGSSSRSPSTSASRRGRHVPIPRCMLYVGCNVVCWMQRGMLHARRHPLLGAGGTSQSHVVCWMQRGILHTTRHATGDVPRGMLYAVPRMTSGSRPRTAATSRGSASRPSGRTGKRPNTQARACTFMPLRCQRR